MENNPQIDEQEDNDKDYIYTNIESEYSKNSTMIKSTNILKTIINTMIFSVNVMPRNFYFFLFH
jgi:hypothetical protein